ncbi:hypothetical protein TWF481_003466 [Arthrobotrys musiformis]|uniref:Uncharacterized protein n=1 Tax=Arthrobotrys musiformis TaxID=47236 RepID=A0AAV9VQC7_9PEZI
MHVFRFSVLVTALITLVSLCSARTVSTIQKCTTRSCGSPVKVYRTTKTVRSTARYTVTRWKTVTKPAKIVTTTSVIWRTVTTALRTATTTKTITISTSTSTATSLFWIFTPTTTVTSATTTTITPKAVVVSAPSKLFAINEDPDNQPTPKPKVKRAAEPEPEPEPIAGGAKQYASAVTCTRTLLTKTGTSDLWKTTTKKSGTKTVAELTTIPVTTTVTSKGAKIITKTTSVVWTTVTTTTSTVVFGFQWFATTITVVLPTPTNYIACGPRNQAPPEELWRNYYLVGGDGYSPDEPTIYTEHTDYSLDEHGCCAKCWTLPASQGKCIGSIWENHAPWHDDLNDCPGDLDECWITPPGTVTSACRLILESKQGVCRRSDYNLYQDMTGRSRVFSNGPNCLRFKLNPRHLKNAW